MVLVLRGQHQGFHDADCPEYRTRSAAIVGVRFERIRADAASRRRRGARRNDRAHAPRRGRAGLRVQGCQRRQTGLGIPRADRNPAARRQDRRPALCRAELGTHRLQRRRRQGGRQRARRYAERYSLAETDRNVRARHRHPLRRHDGAADQHGGWQTRGRVRQGREPIATRPTPRITCSCARADAARRRWSCRCCSW